MESILIYLAAGIATGLVSGLFGVGGGLTVVPALVLALPYEGVAERYVMHLAIGTSLAVMVFANAVTTAWRHVRGDLDWPTFWRLAWLVALGGAIGAIIGDALDGTVLRWLFVSFIAFTITRDVWRHWLRPNRTPAVAETVEPARRFAARASFVAHGIVTGIVGALLGVGAAVVTVPFLTRTGHTIQAASAIAAGLSAVIGLAAGAGYIVAGLTELGLPEEALGYLYLPAFFGIAVGVLAGSPLGVALSHRISQGLQQVIFPCYLSIVLVVMIIRLQG